jgi:hypothetical protein
MVPVEKILEHWPPITNGSTSTVHSATAQPEGGAQNIVARERMRHNKGIFFNQARKFAPEGNRTWDLEVLLRRLNH